MFCKHCGTELPDDARFCRSCGTSQNQPKKKKKKFWPIVLISLLVVTVLAAGIIWMLSRPEDDTRVEKEQNTAVSDTQLPEAPSEQKDDGPRTVYLITAVKQTNFEYEKIYKIYADWSEDGLLTEASATAHHLKLEYDENYQSIIAESNNDHYEFQFDERYNLLRYVDYQNGKLNENSAYTYDQSDNVLTETVYDFNNQPTIFYEYTYDNQGNQLTCTKYNADNLMIAFDEYTYNKNNICILHESYEYNAETGALEEHSLKDYDDEGVIQTHQIYEGDSTTPSDGTRYEYIWSDDRKEKTVIYHHLDGSGSHTNIYAYDDQGNELHHRLINSKGDLVMTADRTYDERGNQLSLVVCAYDGGTNYSSEYTYDENNNILTEKYYRENSLYTLTEYTYEPLTLSGSDLLRYERLSEVWEKIF